MVVKRSSLILFLLIIYSVTCAYAIEGAGVVRGTVYDVDFGSPLPGARVSIAETGTEITATQEGNYVINNIPPGAYTLVIKKDGYAQFVKPNVVVSSGQMSEVDASLVGEVTEMEEFAVQDVQIGGSSDTGLLQLRLDSPALLDSVGADMMSRAGAGDAASALKLVSGATVQDGKFAVIRGLPDRYVNSQMNHVRLPTADEDKRAVQLDQFPSEVIESIQISKTFTPDQQGDASGGAVNVVLKGIPDKSGVKVKYGQAFDPDVIGNEEFLTYGGGGVTAFGTDDGRRAIPVDGNFKTGERANDALGVVRQSVNPISASPSITLAKRIDFDNGVSVGGLASPYYKRDSSFMEDSIDDSYVYSKGAGQLVPITSPSAPSGSDEFTTSLFNVDQSVQEVQWGVLTSAGVKNEDNSVDIVFMRTQSAEDKVTLAEDTRGKEFYFPGYSLNDPNDPGNGKDQRGQAPYLRHETLQYTERTTDTLQWTGDHKIPFPELGVPHVFTIERPQISWTIANSSSGLFQPDKRFFASKWLGGFNNALLPTEITQEQYQPLPAGANINLGNVQRIWKDIDEKSDQYFVDFKFPFKQWTDTEGYVKWGVFSDVLNRTYNQDSFSNFGQQAIGYPGDWDEDSFSGGFPTWSGAADITDGSGISQELDVDYKGHQEISAWYYMTEMPVWSKGKLIFGARYEMTELGIINDAEKNAVFVDKSNNNTITALSPGVADAEYKQYDVLPAFGFVLGPYQEVTLRGAYSQTVARQTFKELSPIQQQEYLGADVFIGDPGLKMSALSNYDLRLEYVPFSGSLLSTSWFRKDISNPIEYVQDAPNDGSFIFTTPENFPSGEIYGYELEARMDLGHVWNKLGGLTLGANFTRIDSEVMISEEQQNVLKNVNIYESSREMLNAPHHLYNIFMTADLDKWGTELGLFYTVRGDTLIAGSGQSKSRFIPSVFETEYGTVNLTCSKKISEDRKLVLKIGNLLDPDIQEVFRSDQIGGDVVKTSYNKGMTFAMSVDGVW